MYPIFVVNITVCMVLYWHSVVIFEHVYLTAHLFHLKGVFMNFMLTNFCSLERLRFSLVLYDFFELFLSYIDS